MIQVQEEMMVRSSDVKQVISKQPLTLGAEAWSGPRQLFGRLPFLGSFVLVASRLQGRKFLSRESRQ